MVLVNSKKKDCRYTSNSNNHYASDNTNRAGMLCQPQHSIPHFSSRVSSMNDIFTIFRLNFRGTELFESFSGSSTFVGSLRVQAAVYFEQLPLHVVEAAHTRGTGHLLQKLGRRSETCQMIAGPVGCQIAEGP
jgi:hypothetical protein